MTNSLFMKEFKGYAYNFFCIFELFNYIFRLTLTQHVYHARHSPKYWSLQFYRLTKTIKIIKRRRTQVIEKWKIGSLWKTYYLPIIYMYCCKLLFRWMSHIIVWQNFDKKWQESLFLALISLQSLDVICHKVLTFIIEKFSNKSYIALLFGNIRIKFHSDTLKLGVK